MCLFVLEDITPSVQRQRDWETPGGIGPISECLFMGQKYDLATIVVSHTLSGTSPIIRDNAETIVMFAMPGEHPRLICDTLGVTLEEAQKIKTLRPGELVIFNPALWEKCVYATFEKPQISGKLEESERRRTVEDFLKRIKVCGPAPLDVFRPALALKASEVGVGTGVQHNLTSLQLEMLVLIATGVPRPTCELYAMKGLTRSQGWRLTKALELMGLIVPHFLPTGKRGGQLCFYDVTEYGWQILAGMGILRPKSLTNGSFIHELAARLIEAWGKKQSRIVKFELNIENHRLDGELIDKASGERVFFNIGVTDTAREIINIESILKLPAMQISKFIFVARDKSFADEVQKILKAKDPAGNLLKRVEMKTIADFIGA